MKIQSKMNSLEWPQDFSHYKYMCVKILSRSRAGNSAVHGWNWSKFELIRVLMAGLLPCKNEDDPIKNKGTRVATGLYADFSDAQGQIIP